MALTASCSRPGPEEVLVRINHEEILVGDLQKEVSREKGNYPPEVFKNKKAFLKIKKRILEEMIDRKLLLEEALSKGTYVGEEELQKELELFKNQYTEMSFQDVLRKAGVSPEEWTTLKKENLIIKRYLDRVAALSHPITPEMVKSYYEQNLDSFRRPESVRVRQIVTDSKEKAESILRRLQNGENFAKLARDLSLSPDRKQGGDLGYIVKGSFPREFEVCFSMNPGEVSPIIPSPYGFHIFKVLEKSPEKLLALNEVEAQITLELKRKWREEERKKLLEELKGRKKILINDSILERVTI